MIILARCSQLIVSEASPFGILWCTYYLRKYRVGALIGGNRATTWISLDPKNYDSRLL
jgi:hypothetical protein